MSLPAIGRSWLCTFNEDTSTKTILRPIMINIQYIQFWKKFFWLVHTKLPKSWQVFKTQKGILAYSSKFQLICAKALRTMLGFIIWQFCLLSSLSLTFVLLILSTTTCLCIILPTEHLWHLESLRLTRSS